MISLESSAFDLLATSAFLCNYFSIANNINNEGILHLIESDHCDFCLNLNLMREEGFEPPKTYVTGIWILLLWPSWDTPALYTLFNLYFVVHSPIVTFLIWTKWSNVFQFSLFPIISWKQNYHSTIQNSGYPMTTS